VYGSRGRASFASAAPSGIVSLGGLAARSGSCIDESALNAVPFDGGVDLFEDEAVLEFFTTSTGNLLAAEKTAGVGHHVALSVVGTERLSNGYSRAKLAQEKLIKASGIPYSIVHATQFFEFVRRIADSATKGNMVRLPHALIQPIAADAVAGELARTAVGEPTNGTIEIAGPEQFGLDELIRKGLSFRGDPREVVADPEARYFGALLQERTLVPGADATILGPRFEDWLVQTTPQN
jgi:uncharacterized protein YbjT (DUF2867 family)